MNFFKDDTRGEWISLNNVGAELQLQTSHESYYGVKAYNINVMSRVDGGTTIKFDIKGGMIVTIPKAKLIATKLDGSSRKLTFDTDICSITNNIMIYPKHIEWTLYQDNIHTHDIAIDYFRTITNDVTITQTCDTANWDILQPPRTSSGARFSEPSAF